MNIKKILDRRLLSASLVITILVIAIVAAVVNLRQLNHDTDSVAHTYEVMDARAEIVASIRGAVVYQSRYLSPSSNLDSTLLDKANEDLAEATRHAAHLNELTVDNNEQHQRATELQAKIGGLSTRWSEYSRLREEQGYEAMMAILEPESEFAAIREIESGLAEIESTERQLLGERLQRADRTYSFALISTIVTGLVAVFSVLALSILSRRQLALRTDSAISIAEHAERLRITLASIGDAVIATNSDGRVTMLNDVASRLTGWTEGEALGMSLLEVMQVVDEPSQLPDPDDSGIRGRDCTIVNRQNGTRRTVDRSAAPIRNTVGSSAGIVIVFRDVTEQRNIEDTIRESEQRYRLIGGAANDAIWDWNLLTGEVLWNEGLQAHFGYAAEDIRCDIAWWKEQIHPLDRARVLAGIDSSDDGGWNDEFRFRRADGTFAPVWGRARSMSDADGRIVRRVGSVFDLTDRIKADEALRQSEERVRIAVEGADIGTWDYDPVTGELTWSERCKAIFGLQSDASVDYPKFLELLHPDDLERADCEVQAALDPTGEGQYEIDYRVVWPNGEIRWVVAQGQAQFEGEGNSRKAVRFAGTVLDITERKHAEERLREETRIAETLHRIGNIVAGELELETIVQAVTDEATNLTEAEFGAFFYNVQNDEGESYLLYSLSGIDAESFQGFPMPRKTDLFRKTFSGEGVVRLDDVTRDPAFGNNEPYFGLPPGHLPVKSYLAVPVMTRQCFGRFVFWPFRRRRFYAASSEVGYRNRGPGSRRN